MNRASSVLLVVAVLSTGACASLLGIKEQGGGPRPFAHREHALAGVHCLSCHQGIEGAGETGALHIPDEATCRSCHEQPHDERPCGTCHGLPFARGGAERAREVLRFEHRDHHATRDCVRCHADAGAGTAILRPRMAHCLSCHGHDDQYATRECDACHVDLLTEGTMPEDHLIHGEDFVRDHAAAAQRDDALCSTCHAERTCAGCHTGSMMPVQPDRLAFDVARGPGLHRAGFLARHAEESRNAPGLCTTCHAPESCSDCHTRSRVDGSSARARSPHPPGWLGLPGSRNDHGPATWRDPASCEACHGGAGEALCVQCHAVGAAGGSPHPPGFDPPGRKTSVPCVRCHQGGR